MKTRDNFILKRCRNIFSFRPITLPKATVSHAYKIALR